ncbi:MAG: STAS domain-containing protein [Gammaproteobacteria bacterium]|nr:MAG: STAS domain-containing protein [Gammaproteobacteria bacterium]
MQAELRQSAPGAWQVIGSVTLQTATELLELPGPAAGNGELYIDWSRVEVVDSAAVALMIEWLRQARQADVRLRFSGLSAPLRNLLQVFDLDAPLAGVLA